MLFFIFSYAGLAATENAENVSLCIFAYSQSLTDPHISGFLKSLFSRAQCVSGNLKLNSSWTKSLKDNGWTTRELVPEHFSFNPNKSHRVHNNYIKLILLMQIRSSFIKF